MNAELLRLADSIEAIARMYGADTQAMERHIYELRSLAAQPAAQDGWRPIESASRDDRMATVVLRIRGYVFPGYWHSDKACWISLGTNDRVAETPDGWQPLPPAPQGD